MVLELFGKRQISSLTAATLCAILIFMGVDPAAKGAVALPKCRAGGGGALPADTYVPMDSWVYPALDRLRGLGYLDTAFLGLRPWTRRSIQRMIDGASQENGIQSNSQAAEILAVLQREFGNEDNDPSGLSYGCNGLYTRLQGISGLTLRDSFHLGQTLVNDYGRPYQPGFNTVDGVSGSAEFGRFSLYARGEYQHAPSAAGYSPALVQTLWNIDALPGYIPIQDLSLPANPAQAAIPAGPIAATDAFRILEANISYRVLNHEISFGKSDHWLAPTVGGAFMYSNNAENIYAFQIDRTEPLYIPLLSRLTGPFRYDFFVGSLKGHTNPNDPWMHMEKINFKPTPNIEFGFERTAIWGGKGHGCQFVTNGPIEPCTEPFLKSFFSTTSEDKLTRDDPGARFASFDFSWRLPWLTHWMTLYTDSMIHDDVSPIDAPRHAGVRPGIFLSRFPGIKRLDFRMEGVNTDPETSRSFGGTYLYWEGIQLQGYTNKSNIMGDAIGREGKGGQAWLTYHLSPSELVQVSFRNKKNAKDFIQSSTAAIPSGTTQNSFDIHVVKRIQEYLELSADLQHEWWKAPIYQPGEQTDTVATFQVTLYSERKTAP
jgi:hypothetical protein